MGASTIVTTLAGAGLAVGLSAPTGRIVAEWEPGFGEAELGGELVVDGYGVDGLGVYQVRLDDGTAHAAVCVQADVGHSLAADYAVEDGTTLGPELGYLAWAYLTSPALTDVQAAAINLLAWRYTDAQRRTGGPVWLDEEIEVAVLGVGRRTDVEAMVAALQAEATARRGPWSMTELTVADGAATVVVAGPGGPIADAPVTFTGDAGWTTVVATGPDGRAAASLPAEVGAVEARAAGPGSAIALSAPGSQRLAAAGPPAVLTAVTRVPTTTTTTTTTSTTSTPTTTSLPPTTTTTSTTTMPPTTTSTTSPTSTSSTTATVLPATMPPAPPPTAAPAPPARIPRTGSTSRSVVRLGSILFAAGAAAVLLATRRPQVHEISSRSPSGRGRNRRGFRT